MSPKGKTSCNIKLKMLEAQKEALLERVERLYKVCRESEGPQNVGDFLAEAFNIDSVVEKIKMLVEEINLLHLSDDEKFLPNFDLLGNLDFMLGIIKKCEKNLDQPVAKQSDRPAFKLPKINLVEFDGDPKNWHLFFDTFKNLVHENRNLDETTKFHYLTGVLKGRAREMCAGVLPSASNYQVIWKMLIDKFQDSRLLANTYLKQILNFKNMVGDSASTLNYFIEKFDVNVKSLLNLGLEDLGDFMLTTIALSKLDPLTQKQFETSRNGALLPTYSELLQFVHSQAKALSRVTRPAGESRSGDVRGPFRSNGKTQAFSSFSKDSNLNKNCSVRNYEKFDKFEKECCLCKGEHLLINCRKFLDLEPLKRFEVIKNNNLCLRCLGGGHRAVVCKVSKSCSKCNHIHHTLLHFEKSSKECEVLVDSRSNKEPLEKTTSIQNFCSLGKGSTNCGSLSSSSNSVVLLSTVVVNIVNKRGMSRKARFLLDSASQSNFVTSKFCKSLGLNIDRSCTVVRGIGSTEEATLGQTEFTVVSRFDESAKFEINALVINKITDDLPTVHIAADKFRYLNCLKLADDTPTDRSEVDGILGASLFVQVVGTQKIQGSENSPMAIESLFGFIVMGEVSVSSSLKEKTVKTLCTVLDNDIENTLNKFWELEEVPKETCQSADDVECERIFVKNVSRDESGRYSVSLPFKESPTVLGNSYEAAFRRFKMLERKLNANPGLAKEYSDVIRDYLGQGHMVEDTCATMNGYFVPHHAVIKNESISTKVRVVFDASCRTDSSKSLNDILYVGPKLYADLCKILLGFRLFPVAVTADIRQMYRMIRMSDEHQNYQKILWRWSPEEPIKSYKLTTVTFGISSSPFLALRTVKKLIEDEKSSYPLAASVADSDIYMDDLASSVLDENMALPLCRELIDLFKSGGFDLVKWSSNSSQVLESIPENYRHAFTVDWDQDWSLKILGLQWEPSKDEFFFRLNYSSRPCTKRNILSTVARIFDPLGLLTPITLGLKIMIKRLWLEKLDWDEVPSSEIQKGWKRFEEEMEVVPEFRFDRHLGVKKESVYSLIGFCDASEVGYGAVLYSRVCQPDGKIKISLICGKSKVSPVKFQSLPRLELCGALLLSKLMKVVYSSYNNRFPIENVFCFSDSMVALAWIKSSANNWKTFVNNRVAQIQENCEARFWFHVRGNDNPADLASRGCLPSSLKNNSLWFEGPSWLKSEIRDWPISSHVESSNLEAREVNVLVAQEPKILYWDEVFGRFSNWNRLIRTFVFILRFAKLLPRNRNINAGDLDKAENCILNLVQRAHFEEELKLLTQEKESLKLKKLSPFLVGGLIRVGGRLANSELGYDQRHPILLPSCHITNLIIDYLHKKNFHTGPHLLTALIRQKYWIVGGRNLVKRRIRSCNLCFRFRPRPSFPKMADLPPCRVREAKAFLHTGVDFAGPFFITLSRHRGVKSQKAYICLFICLVTKAIHLELVSSLTTDCFILALKRFLSRRGPCAVLYSDNGTNFIGAKNQLDEVFNLLESNSFKETWEGTLAEYRITWKLNPPSAPHFGGIWEANIKSVKTLLFKLVKGRILSFEEFSTVLVLIEGILNSRPLSTLSDDPNDPSALTPAHFLNQAPLKHLPSKEEIVGSKSLKSRFEYLMDLVSSFWKRWKLEYLHTLQTREKWNTVSNPIRIGSVVLVHTENVLPMEWPLGVVTALFPGKDGVIRVVEVRTKKGAYRRPVVKLCPLPSQ